MNIARLITTARLLSRPAVQQATRTCAFLNRPEMTTIAQHIEEKIQQNKVMVFSKSTCPFCTKAKRVFAELIEENKLSPNEYEIMEIEDNPHCDMIQDHLGRLTGARSVPRVFIKQQCLGGGDDVVAAHVKGELEKLLS